LASELDGGDWLISHPGHFISSEIAPDTRWMGDWMDPQSLSGFCGELKNLVMQLHNAFSWKYVCSTLITRTNSCLQAFSVVND
jgi:hypothetical protein